MLALMCAVLLCAPLAGARSTTRPSHGKTLLAKSSGKSQRGRQPKATSAKGKRSAGKRGKLARPRGQQAIQQDRAREIQAALIREHYLDGEPSGVWDQRTKDAVTRYQADNGWQTKVLPDSRALIKLRLGPNHSNLINPETAATTLPPTTGEAEKRGPNDGPQR